MSMNSARFSAAFADSTRRGRFVVPCPMCAAEDGQPKSRCSGERDACALCDDLGLVPRVVAERYELDLNPVV